MRLVLKRYAAFSICARTYASTAAKPGNGPSPLTGSGAVPRHLSSLRGPSRRSRDSPRRQSGPEFAEAPADLARCYCAGGETNAGAAGIEAPGTRDVAADFAAAFVVWFDPATSAFSIGIRVPSRCGAGGSRLRGADLIRCSASARALSSQSVHPATGACAMDQRPHAQDLRPTAQRARPSAAKRFIDRTAICQTASALGGGYCDGPRGRWRDRGDRERRDVRRHWVEGDGGVRILGGRALS